VLYALKFTNFSLMKVRFRASHKTHRWIDL
jgi:hypothetical protein